MKVVKLTKCPLMCLGWEVSLFGLKKNREDFFEIYFNVTVARVSMLLCAFSHLKIWNVFSRRFSFDFPMICIYHKIVIWLLSYEILKIRVLPRIRTVARLDYEEYYWEWRCFDFNQRKSQDNKEQNISNKAEARECHKIHSHIKCLPCFFQRSTEPCR